MSMAKKKKKSHKQKLNENLGELNFLKNRKKKKKEKENLGENVCHVVDKGLISSIHKVSDS